MNIEELALILTDGKLPRELGREEFAKCKRLARAVAVKVLEEASKVCRDEAALYEENGKACYAAKNTFGGSMDASGAQASRRCATVIDDLSKELSK